MALQTKREIRSADLLPGIFPTRYHLALSPSDDYSIVQGRVRIDISLELPTAVVRLHILNLTVAAACAFVESSKNELRRVEAVSIAPGPGETVEISFTEHLPQTYGSTESVFLELDFVAPVLPGDRSENLHGFYRINGENSPYLGTENGLCTQFEPCDARRAFPCFDEPALRCPVSLDFIVPATARKTDVLFNTTVSEVIDSMEGWPMTLMHFYSPGRRLHRFPESPSISTYLVGIISGEFSFVEDTVVMNYDATGKPAAQPMRIRCIGPVNRAEECTYALAQAKRAVEFFNNKLECGLPMDKIDLIGVPLSGLGMENNSLITFRHDHFLVNSSTPFVRLQRITRVIYHEVAHQWFGNLVTIQWWAYLYLKEGLARFLEYHLIEETFPEWNYWKHFHHEIYTAAIERDEMEDKTHPVEVPIGTDAREVASIFDVISYGKAACLLRAVANFAGVGLWPAFRRFIHANLFGAVSSPDLWKAMAEETGRHDLVSWLNIWMQRAGHPIVKVSRSSGGVWSYKQFPMFDIKEGEHWEPFPIFCVARVVDLLTGESRMEHMFLADLEGPIPIQLGPHDLLFLNSNHVGFFRVAVCDWTIHAIANLSKLHHRQKHSTPLLWLSEEIDALVYDYSSLLLENPDLFPLDHLFSLLLHSEPTTLTNRKMKSLFGGFVWALLVAQKQNDHPELATRVKTAIGTQLARWLTSPELALVLPKSAAAFKDGILALDLVWLYFKIQPADAHDPAIVQLARDLAAMPQENVCQVGRVYFQRLATLFTSHGIAVNNEFSFDNRQVGLSSASNQTERRVTWIHMLENYSPGNDDEFPTEEFEALSETEQYGVLPAFLSGSTALEPPPAIQNMTSVLMESVAQFNSILDKVIHHTQ